MTNSLNSIKIATGGSPPRFPRGTEARKPPGDARPPSRRPRPGGADGKVRPKESNHSPTIAAGSAGRRHVDFPRSLLFCSPEAAIGSTAPAAGGCGI